MTRRAARYDGLSPASPTASRSARGASAKRDTKPEKMLRAALRLVGLKGYRVDVAGMPGRPDIVFGRAEVAVFCDGDFWHGKDLDARIAKLKRGHNSVYWVEKIRGNVARDRRHEADLRAEGWKVLRYWESDVRRDPSTIASEVKRIVESRRDHRQGRSRPRKTPGK